MSSVYFVTPKTFDPLRLVVKPVRKEKTPKFEYDKSDIFYRYQCRKCFNNQDCDICGTDCECGLPQGCSNCINGKRNNDVTRELLVFMENVPFDGGLFFSKDPTMYGNASLITPIDINDENMMDIFGDTTLELGSSDGFLKNLRRSFLRNIKSVAPSKYPKIGGKAKDIEDIVNDKAIIKQDVTMPLSEEERAADTSKKGVSVPTKYFKLKYFASKKILEADENTLSDEQRRTKRVMERQRVNGIDARDVPVGTWTGTQISVAVVENDKIKLQKLPSFTVLKRKNLVVNMMIKYPYATFSPKLSISESIDEITIHNITSTEQTCKMSSSEFIDKLTLTSEQSKRNMREIEESDGEQDDKKDEEVSEPTPFDIAAIAGIPPV